MNARRTVRLLEDVMSVGGGAMPIQPLVEAVREADVDAGVLCDEELYLMSPRLGEELEPEFDAPRLSALAAEQRDVAVASAVFVLRAHGLLQPTEDGNLGFVGIPAVVADVRWGSEAVVRVRVDIRDRGIVRAAIYRVRPELFLTEEVGEDGLHHFTFRSAVAQAAHLAALVDPNGRARATGPPQAAASIGDLGVTSEELAAGSEAAALAVSLAAEHRGARKSFTAYSGDDGLQVLHGWRLPDRGEVQLQQLGRQDLVAFCAAFLAP